MNKLFIEKPEAIFLFPDIGRACFSYHLGIAYIQSYLWEKNIYSIQYLNYAPSTLEENAQELIKLPVSLVGFSCYDANFYYVKILSELIKRRRRDLLIVIGGPSATFSDEIILRECPYIDMCVRGEGEVTLYEILVALKGNVDFSNIRGITYRRAQDIIRNKDRPLFRGNGKGKYCLDSLPSPYLKSIVPVEKLNPIGIITSRGCIFRCSFCNFTIMSKCTIRFHSPERVIQELEKINSTRPNELVNIFDDMFTVSRNRTIEFCGKLIEKNLNLKLSCLTRADFVDKELLEIMYKSGFRKIVFGLESGVDKVLKAIKKCRCSDTNSNNLSREMDFLSKIKENVKIAQNLGFDTSVSVILGLPAEKFEDGIKTIDFVRNLNLKRYTHNFLKILPGTELFNSYEKYGIQIKKSPTTLPYLITKYAYDVSKVPVLMNSNLYSNKRVEFYNVMKIISGVTIKRKNLKYPAHFTFLHNIDKINLKILKWLKNYIVPGSILSFICTSTSQNVIRKINEDIINAKIPAIYFYILKSFNSHFSLMKNCKFVFKKAIRGTVNIEDKILSTYVHFVPFNEYTEIEDIQTNKTVEENLIIFTLLNPEDIIQLIKFEKKILSGKYSFIGEVLDNHPCFFIDSCRWSDNPCYAPNVSCMVITQDFFIKPCLFGEPIGEINEDRNVMIERLKNMKKKEEIIRGCEQCEIRDSCSRCLFPSPLTSEEYCKIRKKHPNIPEVIKFINFKAGSDMKILLKPD